MTGALAVPVFFVPVIAHGGRRPIPALSTPARPKARRGVSASPRRPRTFVPTNARRSLPKGSTEQAFEVWNEYRIRDFKMKRNEPHLTLRQAQREDLILSLSKHKVRDKESRFLKCRIRPGSAGDDVCSRALPRNAGPSPPAAAGRATTKKMAASRALRPASTACRRTGESAARQAQTARARKTPTMCA